MQQGAYTFEVIISEPGGHILLDTVTTSNGPLVTTLTSPDSLIDVTTITKDTSGYYAVYAYKGANPSGWGWSEPLPSYQLQYPTGPYTQASLFCKNLPPQANLTTPSAIFYDVILNNLAYEGNLTGYDNVANTVSVGYNRFANAYNYLLLQYSDLYTLYKPQSDDDTIDLTHLDTAVKVLFNRPYPYTIIFYGSQNPTMLVGLPDTTDLSQAILFSAIGHQLTYSSDGADFEIPKMAMQKYELRLDATISNNDQVYFYSYANSIPATPVFLDPNSFTVLSTQSDSFSINFTAIHPSYYYTQWSTNNVTLQLWASPDSNTVHPVSFLNGLKSKLLKGIPYSNLQLTNLQLETTAGYAYGAFLYNNSSPASSNVPRVTSSSMLNRTFP